MTEGRLGRSRELFTALTRSSRDRKQASPPESADSSTNPRKLWHEVRSLFAREGIDDGKPCCPRALFTAPTRAAGTKDLLRRSEGPIYSINSDQQSLKVIFPSSPPIRGPYLQHQPRPAVAKVVFPASLRALLTAPTQISSNVRHSTTKKRKLKDAFGTGKNILLIKSNSND